MLCILQSNVYVCMCVRVCAWRVSVSVPVCVRVCVFVCVAVGSWKSICSSAAAAFSVRISFRETVLVAVGKVLLVPAWHGTRVGGCRMG